MLETLSSLALLSSLFPITWIKCPLGVPYMLGVMSLDLLACLLSSTAEISMRIILEVRRLWRGRLKHVIFLDLSTLLFQPSLG